MQKFKDLAEKSEKLKPNITVILVKIDNAWLSPFNLANINKSITQMSLCQ